MEIYIVDSNFFIQPHRDTYPLDVAVSFWAKVKQLADEGKIVSIDKVKNEIFGKNDDLEKWCRANLPKDFFKETSTSDVIIEYVKICSWATSKSGQYTQAALNEFLNADEADAFVGAYALADVKNRIVVTQEVSSPTSKKRVKLPDACIAQSIQCLNTVEMFRKLGETF
jgi:hypothetical protein